ncbi:MAG: lactate racemase domain-containing protein [Flavonifractor plautii]
MSFWQGWAGYIRRSLGNHAPLTRADFVQKLGEELVEQFPIYNHNPYENLVSVGTDRFGNEVLVNREFMRCDVRIGVGSVSPHPMNGFGGGGKLICPGLAGIRTTYANHSRREFRPFSPEPCGLRRDIEAMTGMVMPFFKNDACSTPGWRLWSSGRASTGRSTGRRWRSHRR